MAFTSIFPGEGPNIYVVAPNGNFGTIQAAIDQAVADGYAVLGTTISLAAGTYTENLDFSAAPNINLIGSAGEDEVFIRGTHTPPATGSIIFSSIKFTAATDVLLDNATAGTCNIKFYNCTFYTDGVVYPFVGYVCNLPNWVGDIIIESCSDISTANSIIFNNGSAAVDIVDSTIGSGAVGARLSGVTRILNSRIFCDLLFVTNAVAQIQDSTVDSVITIDNPATANIYNSYLTHNTSALIDNSTGDVQLGNVVINVTAGDAISGTGTRLHIGEVVYINQSGYAGTLTVLFTASYCAASNLRSYGRVELPETNAAGTQGVVYFGADPVIHSMGTDNIFAGPGAGNLALTVANATDNVAVGSNALNSVTTGAHVIAIGSAAGTNVTTGSNCILIDHPGVAAENQTIRIGTAQTANYQMGIYQASSGAVKEVMWVDNNNKLSSSNIGIVSWVTATASLTAAVNTGYVVDIAIPGLLSIQLPASSVLGDTIEITGVSAGGWSITQGNAADQIIFGNQSSTLGVAGHIDSTNRYDSIRMVCYANHVWKVLSAVGVLNVV